VNIYVKVGNDVIGRGKTMKSCLKYIKKLFDDGHTNIIVSGGKIGSWR